MLSRRRVSRHFLFLVLALLSFLCILFVKKKKAYRLHQVKVRSTVVLPCCACLWRERWLMENGKKHKSPPQSPDQGQVA